MMFNEFKNLEKVFRHPKTLYLLTILPSKVKNEILKSS